MNKANYKKRKRNGSICTSLTFLIILAYSLFIPIIIIGKLPALTLKILLFVYLFLGISLLPYLLIKFQNSLYRYLNKNIDIIEMYLSSDYKPIFLNMNYLESSNVRHNMKRTYFAKLEDDGVITIRSESKENNEYFEEQTSDYSWFLTMFRLEE